MVEHAMLESEHLLVEAGTGTGKTLAYLYPALRYALLTDSCVIVSTGTKSLQDQLYTKDVPALRSTLGDFRVTQLKGRSNYLCREKLYSIEPASLYPNDAAAVRQLRTWESETKTGDRAEITGLPEYSPLWNRLDARAETCTGNACASYDRCFVTQARAEANAAHLVVINHHLFFADLAIRMKNPEAAILPNASTVIFDEAHELEHVASDCFSIGVSTSRVAMLANEVLHAATGWHEYPEVKELVPKLCRQHAFLWDELPGPPGPERFHFVERASFLNRSIKTYTEVLAAIKALHGFVRNHQTEEGVDSLKARLETLYSELRYLIESDDKSSVFWIERKEARSSSVNTHLIGAPTAVGESLKTHLFGNYSSVILTSATMAVNGDFDYTKRTLGVPQPLELVVSSSFDYAHQAMLYLPTEIPEPKSELYANHAFQLTVNILAMTNGRAFCLFTSHAAMNAMHTRLVAASLPYTLLLQGSMARGELLELFRSSSQPVLLGTSSFWQGIDVQGDQLSSVIIDRIPFCVPSDPLVSVRSEALRAAGKDSFQDYLIPRAVIALNQGLGRLIRSASDRGILTILDKRMTNRKYSKLLVESLPPYSVTHDIDELRRFVAEAVVAHPRKKVSSE